MHRKLKLHLNKTKIVESQLYSKTRIYSKRNNKGYLQIDFAIAIFMFFIAFLSFYLLYDSYRGIENQRSILVELNAEARDICSILISSSGVPNTFESDISTLIQPGLKSNLNHSLSLAKINLFNSTNYFTIIDSMGLNSFLHLSIWELESNIQILDFGTSPGSGVLYANYICYSNYDNKMAKVFVEVWR